MRVHTEGITTLDLYGIIKTHLMSNGPSTRDDICAEHPELDRDDVGIALRRLNGQTVIRIGTKGKAAVYDIKRRDA